MLLRSGSLRNTKKKFIGILIRLITEGSKKKKGATKTLNEEWIMETGNERL